jgi:hypothetical protein
VADVSLRGRVRSVREDVGAGTARIVVTSGGSIVGDSTVDEDGAFNLQVPSGDDVVVTVIGEDRRTLRLRADARGELVDLGELEIPVAEFPPGVSGKAWDLQDDRPVSGGVATLHHGSDIVGTDRIDSSGDFAIEMSGDRLLPEGSYQLTIDVPGYESRELRVDVIEGVTSYRVGRVELTARTAA